MRYPNGSGLNMAMARKRISEADVVRAGLRTKGASHNVLSSASPSPNSKAPPLRGCEHARHVGDRAHRVVPPTMPNLVIEPRDMDDLVAYILSLRDRKFWHPGARCVPRSWHMYRPRSRRGRSTTGSRSGWLTAPPPSAGNPSDGSSASGCSRRPVKKERVNCRRVEAITLHADLNVSPGQIPRAAPCRLAARAHAFKIAVGS
jgi:hypothetical protein